jgi:hypothetical protein
MKHEIRFSIRIDLGKAIPEVGELFSSVNNHLSTMGVQDRIGAYGEVATLVVSGSRKLNVEEQETVRKIIEDHFNAKFPQYTVRVTELGSQSVTSSQSAS